ncbi:hypothetical protein NVP1276O_53 [Vibrio phage 1.276.O._10N.286.54.E4]|nr:hypothetical protein NVP1276O_53 [Vibrio phage 1.276.O._10N.286.54.E4]
MKSKKYAHLKKNKVNAKKVIIELIKRMPVDFNCSYDHLSMKMRQYGFYYNLESKLLTEMCNDGDLVFTGYKPVYVGGNCIGGDGCWNLSRGK